jgi:phosphatidylserine/phosphatidylglycerophosphate/cardiolipin synthase-like enzyme
MKARHGASVVLFAALPILAGCVIPLPEDFAPPRYIHETPLPPRPFPGQPAPPPIPTTAAASTPTTVACFPPDESCARLIIAAIDAARAQIRVQAYSFTRQDIAAALIRAYRRGVDVGVIIDRQHAFENSGMMPRLSEAGITVLVDSVKGLAHSKVMIIDATIVVTGSYNFTSAAERRNAENLLIVSDPGLAARYLMNWRKREAESR